MKESNDWCMASKEELTDEIINWDSSYKKDEVEATLEMAKCVEPYEAGWDDSYMKKSISKLLLKSLLIRAFRNLFTDKLANVPDVDLHFHINEKYVCCYLNEPAYRQRRVEEHFLSINAYWSSLLGQTANGILLDTSSKLRKCHDINDAFHDYTYMMSFFSDAKLGRRFETIHGIFDVQFHSGNQTGVISPHMVSERVNNILNNADSFTVTMEVFPDTINSENVQCSKDAFHDFLHCMGAEDFEIKEERGTCKYMLNESYNFKGSLHTVDDEVVRYIATIPIP